VRASSALGRHSTGTLVTQCATQEWIWKEMEQREKAPELPAGVTTAAGGQDIIVKASAATAVASPSSLIFDWASHYNVLLCRRSCETLAQEALRLRG
jgi:hypothetical protein